MKAQVFVRLKPGVLDVQGKAVERGLAENGLTKIGTSEISNIRVGKLIEFDVNAKSEEQAKSAIDEICRVLLANTIIENYEIKLS